MTGFCKLNCYMITWQVSPFDSIPSSRAEVKATPDVLDMTCIHPESYPAVKKVVDSAGLKFADFQDQSARTAFQEKMRTWSRNVGTEKVCYLTVHCHYCNDGEFHSLPLDFIGYTRAYIQAFTCTRTRT